jgi:hypothetical protein
LHLPALLLQRLQLQSQAQQSLHRWQALPAGTAAPVLRPLAHQLPCLLLPCVPLLPPLLLLPQGCCRLLLGWQASVSRLTVVTSWSPTAVAMAQNRQAHRLLQLLLKPLVPRWHCSLLLHVLLLQQRPLLRTPEGCAAAPVRQASASAQSGGQPLHQLAAAHQLAACRQVLQASP